MFQSVKIKNMGKIKGGSVKQGRDNQIIDTNGKGKY